MANGAAIQKRIAGVLKRLNATSRVVSLRTVTNTGGNSLLGLGGTTSASDTECDPQPAVQLVDAEVIANSGGLFQAGDYFISFDGATEEATLRNSQIVYGDEILKIIKMNPVVIDGTVVVWEVTARSIKAGS